MLIPEIKSWQKNFGVDVVRNNCGHPGHKVSELTAVISHADTNSGKLRITLIMFGWLCWKTGMGLQFQWIDESSWIFCMLIHI